MLKHTDIYWHPGNEVPKKSGHYLVFTSGGNITTIEWSSRHKRWNASDAYDACKHGWPTTDPYIVAWADTKLTIDSLREWIKHQEAKHE